MLTKIKAMFGWRTVRKDSLWRYQENRVTGQRRAHRRFTHYTPPDQQWLRRIAHDPVPPKVGSGSQVAGTLTGRDITRSDSRELGEGFEMLSEHLFKKRPNELGDLQRVAHFLAYQAADPATDKGTRAKYMAAARTCRELASKIEADSGNR